MRKFAVLFAALCLLLALPAVRADATYYWFQVKDQNLQPITSGFTCHVITTASITHDTLFTDNAYGTQKTNPVNPNSQGVCSFATNATTVDVSVWGTAGKAKGATGKADDATETDHVIVINTNAPTKHLRLFWDRGISKGAEVNTGVDLPVGAVVDDVWIEVATGTARASVSVGLLSTDASGDADGFCASVRADLAVAPGQFFRCAASRTAFTNVGMQTKYGDNAFYWSSSTRGVYLGAWAKGADGGYAWASYGISAEFPYTIPQETARRITYTTNDIGGHAGYIHLFYKELRNR